MLLILGTPFLSDVLERATAVWRFLQQFMEKFGVEEEQFGRGVGRDLSGGLGTAVFAQQLHLAKKLSSP
jgi:hypothetical protein